MTGTTPHPPWFDPTPPRAEDCVLRDVLRRNAAAHADRTCVEHEGETWRFGEAADEARRRRPSGVPLKPPEFHDDQQVQGEQAEEPARRIPPSAPERREPHQGQHPRGREEEQAELLVRHEATKAATGRVYGDGRVFTEDGVLVAAFQQDSMARAPTGPLDPKRSM